MSFRSLCDSAIHTTTTSGELIFHTLTALAQFERRLIQERTKVGQSAARVRGRKGGRKPVVPTAKEMHADRSVSVTNICQTLRISRPTLYRYVALK